MGTIFLAGIYGVGKSTLAEKISIATNIPYYSAGDLISAQNGEKYGPNKAVADKNRNQDVLAECVSELLLSKTRILLAGHFCILDKQGQVDLLPAAVFDKLQIEKIILLEAAPSTIKSHLESRDDKKYSTHIIETMLEVENNAAQKAALRLAVPLILHKMDYSERDLDKILSIL